MSLGLKLLDRRFSFNIPEVIGVGVVADRGNVFQIQVTELCALNPELMDHINNVTSNAVNPPRPAPEKVNIYLLRE